MGGFVGNPFDIINIRMQGDKQRPLDQRRGYKNAFDGLFKVIRNEGLPAILKGINVNVMRSVIITSSQLVSYDQFKRVLVDIFQRDNMSVHFSASFLAVYRHSLSYGL